MPVEFNHDRAVFYPANDYAASFYVERVKLVLSGGIYSEPATINDAIEAYQCKLIVEGHPCFFEEAELSRLQIAAKDFYAKACRLVSSMLERKSLSVIFDEVEFQFESQFWEFIATNGLWEKIPNADLESLLNKYPSCLRDVLQIPAMVKRFDACLRKALLFTQPYSAELIIRELGVRGASQTSIFLPPSLSSTDIDSIVLAYLKGENLNLNYVSVLMKWPNDSKARYNPSPDVVIMANRCSKELEASLSDSGIGVCYTIGVSFSAEQKACKGVVVQNGSFIPVYGRSWLENYTDDATILNNFIYVFEFMNPKTGLLTLPARKHENSTLIETFTTRAFGEYQTSMSFNDRQVRALMAVQGYEKILKAKGTSLEHALEYAYNHYFESQLGVAGFSVSLPVENTSWLDKCKAMGPEIERVLKAHKVYCDRGVIDDAYFPFIQITRFDSVPSMIRAKYAIPGESFERWSKVLFHDQSPLAFLETGKSKEQEFYHHIDSESVTRLDFYDVYRPLIDALIDGGFVEESQEGILKPADKTHLLKDIWENGAIGLYRASEPLNQVAAELVEEGLAVYSSGLFSPDEAAYMNYMFNDALFSNAKGLRNRYDHANSSVGDPNAACYRRDYYSLLLLLLLVTLKINDDISFALGVGGVEDFVDWPWVDDSLMGPMSAGWFTHP